MLYEDFLNNTGKVCHKWLHYFPVYEKFFNQFRNKSIFMLEIGVNKGGSLQLWQKYFGPLATIVGIDINEDCLQHENMNCHVRIGSQGDPGFLKKIIQEFGTPDIILDDGSHIMDDMYCTFKFLYPLLNNNGIYMVEDTHTCYRENYGGGLKKENTFIEKSKNLIDELNGYHIKNENMITDFTTSTFSISFFDSMVVFEKMKIRQKPVAIKTGSL